MHTLHLTAIDTSRPINAIKGIRAARVALGNTHGATLLRSKEAVESFRSGNATLVGEHANAAVIDAAARTLEVESGGAARGEIDLGDERARNVARAARQANETASAAKELEANEVDDEHVPIGYDACKTAAVLMYMTNGNPAYAVAAARSLANATGDEELYSEVVHFLEDTFPPRD